MVAFRGLENVTIERRGRTGRKVRQDFFAAFAAFAFHGGVTYLDTLPETLDEDRHRYP